MDKSEIIKSKLEDMKNMSEYEIMETLFEVMSMTGSWLKLENLKEILSEEQYEFLVSKVREEEKFRHSEIMEDPEKYYTTKEEIEEEIEENVKGATFVIAKDYEGNFIVKEFSYEKGAPDIKVDVRDIDIDKALPIIKKALKEHSKYGVFHSNENLTADEIPEVLDTAIENITVTRSKRMVPQMQEKLANLGDMSETETKETILEVLSMTQSWMSLEDLEQILSEEQYKGLRSKLSEVIKDEFSGRDDLPDDFKEGQAEGTKFFVVKDEKGNFALRRFDYKDIAHDKNFYELNPEEISKEELEEVALSTMQQHRNYGIFHGNGILLSDQIPEMLDIAIESISKERSVEITPEDIERDTEEVTKGDFDGAKQNLVESAKEKDENSRDDGEEH